jgi:hypothetical protein
MSAVRDCPKCGLVSPPEAVRCDCGYDFVSRTVEWSYLGKRDPDRGELTRFETFACFFAPPFGLFLGVHNRLHGRRQAGNRLIIASAAMLAIPLVIVSYIAGCR